MDEFIAYGSSTELPTIHVISDSVGLTAQAVARAAAAQFGVTNPVIEVLPKVRTFEEISAFIDEHSACLLYTSPSPRDRSLSRMPSSA